MGTGPTKPCRYRLENSECSADKADDDNRQENPVVARALLLHVEVDGEHCDQGQNVRNNAIENRLKFDGVASGHREGKRSGDGDVGAGEGTHHDEAKDVGGVDDGLHHAGLKDARDGLTAQLIPIVGDEVLNDNRHARPENQRHNATDWVALGCEGNEDTKDDGHDDCPHDAIAHSGNRAHEAGLDAQLKNSRCLLTARLRPSSSSLYSSRSAGSIV